MIKSIFTLIARTEIWLVSLVVVISIIETELLLPAVLIATVFWGVRWIAYGRPSRRTPIDFGVIFLVLLIPVTIWATSLPQRTSLQVYRLLLGILFLYSIVNWTRLEKHLGLIIAGILFVGLGLAGGAIISVQWATTKLPFIPAALYQRFTLLVSDTVNPNVLAGSVVLIMPIAIGILLFSWKAQPWAMRILALINLVVCAGILLLTQSRSALIALAVTLGLFVILRWRWGWILVAAAGLCATILYQFGFFPAAANASIDQSGTFANLSLEGRIEIWSRAIYAIQDFSFTGIGMGSFTEVVDLLYPLFLASPGKVAHAHNLFLQVAVDLGIPGLIAWLSILLGVIATAWELFRLGKKQQNHWAAGLGAGLLGSQTVLIIHGLTDAVTWGMVRPAPLVWGIWGTTIAAWYVLSSQTQKKNNLKITQA